MKSSTIKSFDELPLLLNVKEAAGLLGVSDTSIYDQIREKKFPHLRIGKRIMVPKTELQQWIEKNTKGRCE